MAHSHRTMLYFAQQAHGLYLRNGVTVEGFRPIPQGYMFEKDGQHICLKANGSYDKFVTNVYGITF